MLLTVILVIGLSACSNENQYITVHDAIDNNHSEIHIKIGDIDSVCSSDTGLYSLLKTKDGKTLITTKSTQYIVTEEVDEVMNMINGNTTITSDNDLRQRKENGKEQIGNIEDKIGEVGNISY